MTKNDRKLLRLMLHRLECYYPSRNGYEAAPWGDFEGALKFNEERDELLKAARKLVTKLCRKPKPRDKPRDSRLGDHFV